MTTLELAFAWMFGTLFVSATVFLALEWVFDWVSNRRLTQRLLCFFNLHHGHLVIEERVSRYECQYSVLHKAA